MAMFQILKAQQHRRGLKGSRLLVVTREWQAEAEDTRGCSLYLKMTLQGSVEEVHRQQSAAHTMTKQFHVDGMGKVAQAPGKSLFMTFKPLEQQDRL